MVNRQNKTTRPDQVIRDPEMTVERAYIRYATKGNPFQVWMEVVRPGPDGSVPTPDPKETALVFLKHFDVPSQTLSGIGSIIVRKNQTVSELAPIILEKMKWPAGTEFLLYEEIKHTMIDPMKPSKTFLQSEIQDGDIITFQKRWKSSELPQTAMYTDARQYYDYLLNRMNVKFAPLKGEGEEFTLTLSRKMSYEQFAKKVGEHLNVDPTHLRFAPVIASTGKPKQFIRSTVNQTLQQILNGQYGTYGYSMHRPDALYYEILEMSLSEYETKKLLKVTWLPEGISKEVSVEVLVPRTGTVADLRDGLRKKLELNEEAIKKVRLYEAHSGKIYKELSDNFNIAGLNEYVTLYAEPIPEEELNLQPGERVINVYSFDKEPSRSHGIPFKFVVKPDEVFKETKERLSKRTGIKGKMFEKIKFAVVPNIVYATNPRYLEDDDILADVIVDSNDLLGMDHVNKNRNFWNRSESFFIR
ncbi:hypothetical protein VTN31DRAFT_5019 [Thermomyces dupontii]|uniref:uncharacterized protein n=1 Tax=Talaromyces thermophilus TaxID=28565 RepID=UPI0037445AE5